MLREPWSFTRMSGPPHWPTKHRITVISSANYSCRQMGLHASIVGPVQSIWCGVTQRDSRIGNATVVPMVCPSIIPGSDMLNVSANMHRTANWNVNISGMLMGVRLPHANDGMSIPLSGGIRYPFMQMAPPACCRSEKGIPQPRVKKTARCMLTSKDGIAFTSDFKIFGTRFLIEKTVCLL